MEINSITTFLDFIEERQKDHSEELLYFRGEPRSGWELRPSIMRSSLIQFENEMLTELVMRRPDEFPPGNLAISQWVLAQHHGLQTRFLDLTKNPLVAMFHACEDFREVAAKLHVFAVPRSLIKSFNSDTVSLLANFANLPYHEQELLLSTTAGQEGLEYANALRHLYQLIRREKPYFEERIIVGDLFRPFVVEPQQSSERIRSQSGAFLASAYHRRFEREEILRSNPRIPVYAHYTPTIPSDSKEDILQELRLLNITRETLFPGLDESARSITDSYRQRLQEAEGTAAEPE